MHMPKIDHAAIAEERAKRIAAHEDTIKTLREQIAQLNGDAARLLAENSEQADMINELRDVIAQLKTRLHKSEIESARKQGYIDSVRERAELESDIVTPPSTPISRAQLRTMHRHAADNQAEGRATNSPYLRSLASRSNGAGERGDWWNLGR